MKQEKESLSYTVEVRDKKGRVVHRVSAPSRSYVEQWNQLGECNADSSRANVRDIGGTERNCQADTYSVIKAYGGIGGINGIRVGKGTTPVAIDDYALETPCEHGNGVDEFQYQAMVFTEPAVVASTCSFTAKRIMINNSGVTIGIKEIGCYVLFRWWEAQTAYALVFRDILPGTLDVPDGGSITVTYTIAVTV